MTAPLEERARIAMAQFYGLDRAMGLEAAESILAEKTTPSTPSDALAKGLARIILGTSHVALSQYDESDALAQRVLADGEDVDLPELRARGLRLLAQAARFQGLSSRALRLGGEALDNAVLCGDGELVAALSLDTAAGLLELDGYDDAIPLLQQLHAAIGDGQWQRLRAHVHTYYATALLGVGHLPEALAMIDLVCHWPSGQERLEHRLQAMALRVRILRHMGEHETEQYFADALKEGEMVAYRDPLNCILLERGFRRLEVDGNFLGAIEDFEGALGELHEPYYLPRRVEAYAALAENYRRLNDERKAAQATRRAIEHAREERQHHLREIKGVLTLDAELMARGRISAAEHARIGLAELLAEQVANENRDVQSRLSGAMHDVRGPLMVLQWITSPTSAFSTRVEVAQAAIQHIADTVSLLETRLIEYEAENAIVADVLAGAAPLYERRAAEKQSRVVVRCTTRAMVSARRSVIRRVALNLVENALKFSPPSSEIHIVVHAVGDELSLCIVDQGPGFSAPATPTAGESSTGLGLGIVRDLLRECGGTLRLYDIAEGGCAEVRWPVDHSGEDG